MRPRYEGPTLAERLNNALGELHALKLEHQTEKDHLLRELKQLREDNERLKNKNKEMRKQQRQPMGEAEHPALTQENEQNILKIKNYLQRIQESSRQMTQVAAQCKIVDEDIEKAASQIERNIIKSKNGLQKYTNELVRRWGAAEHLRIDNQRLQMENKQLFQLTTSLQQNFRETDRLIKKLSQSKEDEDMLTRNKQLQLENTKLRTSLNALSNPRATIRNDHVVELEEKIQEMAERLKNAEQENMTIKNIHQRSMKKLQKLEQQKEERPPDGEGLQEERKQWMEKNQKMYEEVRKLTRDLLLSEESQKKVREELDNCLQIYGQWEQEREDRKLEIEELKTGIETYLQKIEELEEHLSEKNADVETIQEQLEVSEGEKEKIVNVYQLEVQELNDQLFKKQDVITELETIINREHYKLEDLKKQFSELSRECEGARETASKADQEKIELNRVIIEKEDIIGELDLAFKLKEEELSREKKGRELQRKKLEEDVCRLENEKQEIAEVLQQYKEEYHSIQKDLNKAMEELQVRSSQEVAITEELKSVLGSSSFQQNDVWEVIAKVRDKYKAVFDEAKTLREAQIGLLHDLSAKEKDHAEQIIEMKQECQKLNQQLESSARNQQAELKIWKMRIIDKQIFDENLLNGAKSFSQLISAILNSNLPRSKAPSPVKDNEFEVLELKEKIVKISEESEGKSKVMEELKRRMGEIEEEKELQKKLIEEAETERDQAKKEYMSALELHLNEMKGKQEEQNKKSIQLIKLRGQLQELEKTVADLQQSSEGKQKQKQEMTLSISDLQEQIVTLKAQNQKYLNQISHLLEETESANSENTQLTLELGELKEQTQLLSVKAETLKLKCEETTAALSQKTMELVKCQGEIETLSKEIEQLQEGRQAVEQSQSRLLKDKQEAEEEIMQNSYQIINLNVQVQQKTTLIENLEAEIKTLTQRLKQSQIDNSKFKEEIALLQSLNQNLTSQIEGFLHQQTAVETKAQEMKEKERRLKELEQQLDKKADAVTSIIKKSDLLENSEEQEPSQHQIKPKEELPDHYSIVIPEQEDEELGLESTRQSQTFPKEPDNLRKMKEELEFAKLLLSQKEEEIQKTMEGAKQLSQKLKQLEALWQAGQLQIKGLKEDNAKLVDLLERAKTEHSGQIKEIFVQNQERMKELQEKNDFIVEELQEKISIQQSKNTQLCDLLKQREERQEELAQKIQQLEIELQLCKTKIDCLRKQLSSKQNNIANLQEENAHLSEQLEKASLQSAMLCKEVQSVTQQKQIYENRLNEIEELMEDLRNEEDQVGKVKMEMKALESEKNKLEGRIQSLQQEAEGLRGRITEYASIEEDPQILRQSMMKLARVSQLLTDKESRIEMQENELHQLKSKEKEAGRIREELQGALEEKEQKIKKLQEEQTLLNQQLWEKEVKEQENAELTSRLLTVEGQYNDLKEEMADNNSKITILKNKIIQLEEKGETFDSSMVDKARESQILQKENEHLKSEIKKINKEKVLAESQAAKHKFNLEEQQSAIKLRESQMSQFSETTTKNRESQQLIRELKMEIETLKQSNYHLQNQYDLSQNSKRHASKPNEDYLGDLPLQVVSRRMSRTEGKSANTIEQEMVQKGSRSQVVKYQGVPGRGQSESSLTGQLSMLRGQLKTKSLNIDVLERQFKAKTEDYSKLQRRVESLSDQLQLERKRVKNFQELYQNIQSKRLKLVNSKIEE